MDSSKDQTPEVPQIANDKRSSSLPGKHKSSVSLKQLSKKEKCDDQIQTKAASPVLKMVHAIKGKDRGKHKKESPLKHKHLHAPTPEDVQRSPRKDRAVNKRLKLHVDLIENVKEENMVDKNNAQECFSDESSDDEEVEWEDVDGTYMYILYI